MDPRSTRLLSWEGDLPKTGQYLRTRSGSVYVIIEVKPNLRPDPKSVAKLSLLKFTPDEIKDLPDDAIFHEFQWTSRKAK
jgi:hypothetical protein